jgi:hypothetical protein
MVIFILNSAILFPGAQIGPDVLKALINLTYWPIYGEMTFIDLIENKSLSSEGTFYAYVSTIIYVCIANVLLLNLLIAMFRLSRYFIKKNTTKSFF